MKILQINTVCGRGSTGRIVTQLQDALRRQGHDCLIAYGRGQALAGAAAYRIGSDLDVKIHAAFTRLTDKTGFASRKATAQLLQKIRAYDPDIIHLHNLHGYYVNIELLFDYLSFAGKKVVWTLHDCWPFTGHCPHFTIAGCNRWEKACHSCPQRKAYPASLFFDNSKWNYHRKKQLFTSVSDLKIVTVSNWLREVTVKSFLGKYPVRTIYNGIDPVVFKPVQSSLRERYKMQDKLVVLGVADGWNDSKGLSCFVELAKAAGSDMVIILVGLTPQQLKKMPPNIIGLARTNDTNELVELYSTADVFVNLSREESFGLVTAEALACGTPAIVVNSTACPEVIDETCGLVVGTGEPDELLKAIRSLRREGPAIRENCLNRARLFDKDERLNDVIALYCGG